MQEWCTIESDPGVFTELIKSIGVKGIQVEEIYDLNDQYQLQQLQPIYGLIFLFRMTSKGEKRASLAVYDSELFFANQVIQNACATQAIVSVLLNSPEIDIGPELSNYKVIFAQLWKDFAMSLDPMSRGLALSNIDVIRTSHNSFSRPEPFIFTGKKKAKEGDKVYHFIAYVPFKGRVYELDGLQDGPILLGETSENVSWIDVAKEAVMKRIAMQYLQNILSYQESEITFSLLAINKCKKYAAEQRIHQLQGETLFLLQQLYAKGTELTAQQQQQFQQLQGQQFPPSQIAEEFPTPEAVLTQLSNVEAQIDDQKAIIAEQNEKFENFKIENARRKHNYIPLIIEILKMASQKGKLEGLIEDAKKKAKQQQ